MLPIIGLGVLLAHAATSPPATDSEINKAWIALVAAMEAASATAVELARKKKAGCSCRCLKPGVGPGIGGRVSGPAECKKTCEDMRNGYTGYRCGGDAVWWEPKN